MTETEVREALATVRARIEDDYATAETAIGAGTATPFECGRHYQLREVADALNNAGLWDPQR